MQLSAYELEYHRLVIILSKYYTFMRLEISENTDPRCYDLLDDPDSRGFPVPIFRLMSNCCLLSCKNGDLL